MKTLHSDLEINQSQGVYILDMILAGSHYNQMKKNFCACLIIDFQYHKFCINHFLHFPNFSPILLNPVVLLIKLANKVFLYKLILVHFSFEISMLH